VEIKNLNSFKNVERALYHEIERQAKAYEAGEPVVQETRLYDVPAASPAVRSRKRRTTTAASPSTGHRVGGWIGVQGALAQ
jgi:Asp-tRNA(Asn)/Glu-tRNA(Gln) amidotransferase B subunit